MSIEIEREVYGDHGAQERLSKAGEPEDLTEYLEEGLKRRERAEMKLRGLLSGPQPHPLIKRKRLQMVKYSAARHFDMTPTPNLFVPGIGLIRHPPYAMKEHPDDLLGDLCRLINEDRDFAADMAPDTSPRKCPTCGEVLAAECFYAYGSRSCRGCNVEGDRIPEAWLS